MRRSLSLVVAPVGLLLATALALAALGSLQEAGLVYSVQALQTGLQHDPGRWVGQAVHVRGVAVTPACVLRKSMLCMKESSDLAYIVDPTMLAFLPLTQGSANSLLSLLRHLPLAGELAPAAQRPHWGMLASYRVQLRAVPPASCAHAPCYQAALLDAVP